MAFRKKCGPCKAHFVGQPEAASMEVYLSQIVYMDIPHGTNRAKNEIILGARELRVNELELTRAPAAWRQGMLWLPRIADSRSLLVLVAAGAMAGAWADASRWRS